MTQDSVTSSKSVEEKAYECFNDIEGQIYFADRLMQGFKEQYFDTSEEAFQSNESAKADFVYNHEYMAAQVQAISDMLFDIRLKCEFVAGNRDDPIIAAHIRNEDQMRSWLRDDEDERKKGVTPNA
ncbi:hypothetical protein CAFE_30840 [Caprobacter fermentans]|uniref:Uncharacterized protein n=1 Tax=Caproicibacter fermentans TaxID=2576756 RepID=A0A6N8I419_9FIRM|nr:hypothetical protein [Caproicibacter fermentans]MVB12350.1 hypothetical protein [Caproicibacter fermentans]